MTNSISISARLVGFVLRKTGYFRRAFSGGAQFQKHLVKSRSVPAPTPSQKMRATLNISQSAFQGRVIWHITPKDRAPTAHILYWHGGGYVYPASSAHWSFLCDMAKAYGWSITAPLYPLAPEFEVDGVTSWALDYYRHYASKNAKTGFIMGGDSAGGGLTAATAMQARDAGLPMASALVLICPWLDVTPDNPEQTIIEPRDAILTRNGIREAGLLYAAERQVTDPIVSPIFGDWTALPPILSFGGGDDILVTDARALKSKLPHCDYIEKDRMIHVWPLLFVPESRAAQKRMAEFVRENCHFPNEAFVPKADM
jgi:epsilon-lactone hydrolase